MLPSNTIMTRVAVLGAGAGGCAVAHRFAEQGFKVSLYDVDEARIKAVSYTHLTLPTILLV